MPPLLPWLAILALLALKPNRGGSTWWIWLPLAGLAAGWHYLELGIESSSTGLPKGAFEVLFDVPVALAFGLAALWLLPACLGRGHRLRAFLGGWFLLVVFIVFSFVAMAGWDQAVEPIMGLLDPRQFANMAGVGVMGMPLLVPLALLALVVAVRAFGWAGLSGARWFLPAQRVAFLVPGCRLGCAGGGAAIFVPDGLAFQHRIWPAPFPWAIMALFTFAMLLPFLILSAANPFYRERLKALLRVQPEGPPVMAPLPDVPLKT